MAKISLSSDILGMSEIHGRKFLNKIKNRKKKNTNLINKLTKPTLKPFFIREGFGHHEEMSDGKTYDKIIHDYMVPTTDPAAHANIKILSATLQQKMNLFTQKWGKKMVETVAGSCDGRAATDVATCEEGKCTADICGAESDEKCATEEDCVTAGGNWENGTWTSWADGADSPWDPTNKIYTVDGEKYLLSENYRQIPIAKSITTTVSTPPASHGCEDPPPSAARSASASGVSPGMAAIMKLFEEKKLWNEGNSISVCKLGKIFKNNDNKYFYQDCDGIIYNYDNGSSTEYKPSCKTAASAADVVTGFDEASDITTWPTWMKCGCTETDTTQDLKTLAMSIIETINEINKAIADTYATQEAAQATTDDARIADGEDVQDSLDKLKLDFEAIQQLFDDTKYTTKSAYYLYIAWTIAALAILSFTIYKINKK